MAPKIPQNIKKDRLQAVEKQIEIHSTAIAQSLQRLLHDENADTDKMLHKLCKGIAGLANFANKKVAGHCGDQRPLVSRCFGDFGQTFP